MLSVLTVGDINLDQDRAPAGRNGRSKRAYFPSVRQRLFLHLFLEILD